MKTAVFLLLPLLCFAEAPPGEGPAGVQPAPAGEAQDAPPRPECEKLLIQNHKIFSRWEYLNKEASQAPPGKASEAQEKLAQALTEFNKAVRRYNQLCSSGGHQGD